MKRKQVIIWCMVIAVLALLVYLQIREWRRFDWEKFLDGSEGINWLRVLIGIGLIYFADFLRAVRWKIFLRPTVPHAGWKGLISPQYVGFAGLALLGRPGELIRPYLIGRKVGASFASQMAIWAVERIFDTGAVTVILVVDIFAVGSVKDVNYYDNFRAAGYALAGLFAFLVVIVLALGLYGPRLASWVCERVSPHAPQFGSTLETRLRSFSEGLNTVHNTLSFIEVTLISLGMWALVALAYREVTHAYPVDTGLTDLELPQVVLLMGASVVGGVLQLPVVGGGAQLATIAVLANVFEMPPELAVSCGILLWLVTFMSVTPLGLALAHREHVSLRHLSAEAETEQEAAAGASPPQLIGEGDSRAD